MFDHLRIIPLSITFVVLAVLLLSLGCAGGDHQIQGKHEIDHHIHIHFDKAKKGCKCGGDCPCKPAENQKSEVRDQRSEEASYTAPRVLYPAVPLPLTEDVCVGSEGEGL